MSHSLHLRLSCSQRAYYHTHHIFQLDYTLTKKKKKEKARKPKYVES